MSFNRLNRRALLRGGLLGSMALPLSGCNTLDFVEDANNPVRKTMAAWNSLTYRAQRLLISDAALAPEFAATDIRQAQKPNGSTAPDQPDYQALQDKNFEGYQLKVSGLVEKPKTYSMADLRAMPARTQITRHDCVEGWSTIAKWQGAPLYHVLDEVVVKPEARFVLFRCYDALTQGLSGPDLYYETIDLVDARHAQTILAYDMNDKPLPVANGAPLRVRVERQLGYKMAKYIRSIELVSGFADVNGGNGGYWEDRGYDWYAGI